MQQADSLQHEDIHTYLDRHQRKRAPPLPSLADRSTTANPPSSGRLLHDTKMIYEDQLAAVKKDSAKVGTTGAGEIDLALLTDGLKAEREQGITIDVAYRYFSTDKRKVHHRRHAGARAVHPQYGHRREQLPARDYPHRRAARRGCRRRGRHSFIVSLLGIKHNRRPRSTRWTLVNYSQESFRPNPGRVRKPLR